MEEFLRIIEKNARLPLEDIAAMLDLTVDETAALMDEAERKGYIHGFETLVDWDEANINRVEAMIELHVSPRKDCGFDEIAQNIAAFNEVDSVFLMSGSYDLMVIIKGKSFQEIALFVAKRLSPLDDVLSTSTSFTLRTYKRGGRFYQNEEIDEREWTES
jgi:DNA-binding Lrp family transcriptional regulator